jgi:lipopolysaccharide export system protein LptA
MNTDRHRYKKEASFSSSCVFIRVHPWFRICFFVGAMALLVPEAHALKGDADQPINIRARSVEANEKTGVSVYSGNVVMTQGSLTIEADRLEVTLRDRQTDLVRATGKPVRMRARTDAGENVRARAARAEYHGKARKIDLFGDVELRRDGDVFAGAVVHYSLDDETFTAEGGDGGQVSATIQPAKKEPSQ